jgi:chromosome segregation ATPase
MRCMPGLRRYPVALLALSLGACSGARDKARADSAQAVAEEQLRLSTQLSAQKDSLTSVIIDADRFITQIDSQISKVKGLPAKTSARKDLEGPLEEQLEARKLMLARVKALVERSRQTASQLAESRRRESALKGENAKLQEELRKEERMIADLGATIERQTATIASLQVRVDSLTAESERLGGQIRSLNKAYYVIGREGDLLKKGIVVREGGANLLVAKVGRTLQPARRLKQELFTPVDQREIVEIAVPDTTKRYRIVSPQNLDYAEVAQRDKSTFRGNLKIKDAEQFWGPSRYLIIVQR